MYSVYSIIANASNIRGTNDDVPEYTFDTLCTMYPQFLDVDEVVANAWIAIATSSLSYARWRHLWEMGVSLYVAHFLTLYAQTLNDPSRGLMVNVEAGLAKGVITSKSVSDMSVSYDFGSVANETQGWGTFNQTMFGLQFVQFAKLVSKGGMTIW